MPMSRRDALATVLAGGVMTAAAADAAGPTPVPDLSRFPKLAGKVMQVLGSVNSFVPPRVGEAFRLDLAGLVKANTLEFDASRRSYIPLTDPTKVESVSYYSSGAFECLRLVSQGKGTGRVIIDIAPYSGTGQDRVLVWVVIERKVVHGVVLIECEAGGEFPKRPS